MSTCLYIFNIRNGLFTLLPYVVRKYGNLIDMTMLLPETVVRRKIVCSHNFHALSENKPIISFLLSQNFNYTEHFSDRAKMF